MTIDAQHLDAEQLSALLDQRLEPADRARAEAHLEACPRCGSELAGLQATVALLRDLPDVEPPRSFLLAEPARPPLALRLAPWARATGALAAAVFVILVSADVLGLATGQPAARPAAAPAAPVRSAAEPQERAPAAAAPAGAAVAPSPAAAPAAARPAQSSRPSLAAPAAPAADQAAPAGAAAPAETPEPAFQARSAAPAAPPTPVGTPAAVRAPPTQPAGSTLRPWQVATGLLAVTLLLGSLLLARLARAPSPPGRGLG